MCLIHWHVPHPPPALQAAPGELADFMRRAKQHMSYSTSSLYRGRAALVSLFCGFLCALTPLSSLAAGSVTLAWDASTSPNIANYKIYYGVVSATYTNSVSAGANLTVSISNLVAGKTYFFAATATDTDGLESDFSTEISALIPVKLTNQPPTLNALANVTVDENAGLRIITLSGITPGATNESQTLTVTAASSNTGLIPNPAVTYTSPNTTGSISFTPVAYAYGSAIVSVTVNDGCASNNITSRSFMVTVRPVNQAPTLNALGNLTIDENASQQTVNLSGIGSGAANESQTLTVTAASGNTGLIPTPTVTYTSPNATGSLRFTPIASASGSATITVTVNDGGASNNIVSRAFTVTVNKVNQSPTISVITNRVIAASTSTPAIPFSISDPETAASSLTVSGSSGNPTLVPVSGIVFGGNAGNRTVRITPQSGQTGSANITITVSDGTASVSRVFLLTVRQRPGAPAGFRIVSTGS